MKTRQNEGFAEDEMASSERKARPPPPPPPPLNTLATVARHRSRPPLSSSVGQREKPPTSFTTDAAYALGLRRGQPLPPPRGSNAGRRSPSHSASSSSVKRHKNNSPPLISTTADDALLLDGDLPLPLLPGIFDGRRPPPLPTSSVERHQSPSRPASLSATEVSLHRRAQTRRPQPGSPLGPLPEDPPRPLCSSAVHSHPTKALTTPTSGSPVLTRDRAITLSINPLVVPIPRATASSYNNLSKQEIDKRQKQQRNMAEVAVVYRSIVLFIFLAVVFYYEYRRLVVLVSEIAAVCCLLLYLWSSHIMQFWLDRPVTKDLSVVVFIWCLVLCMIAFLVGVTTSPVAGMVITCLAATCMGTFFVSSLREYLHTRPGCCLSERGEGFHDAMHENKGRAQMYRMRSLSHQQASVEAGVSRPIKPAWK